MHQATHLLSSAPPPSAPNARAQQARVRGPAIARQLVEELEEDIAETPLAAGRARAARKPGRRCRVRHPHKSNRCPRPALARAALSREPGSRESTSREREGRRVSFAGIRCRHRAHDGVKRGTATGLHGRVRGRRWRSAMEGRPRVWHGSRGSAAARLGSAAAPLGSAARPGGSALVARRQCLAARGQCLARRRQCLPPVRHCLRPRGHCLCLAVCV